MKRKNKRFTILLLLFLFSIFSVFADDVPSVNPPKEDSRVLTAYKLTTENLGGITVPGEEKYFSIVRFDGNEIDQDGAVSIPVTARGRLFDSFSWYIYGNDWGNVSFSLIFRPMYRYYNNTKDTSRTIPYKVTLEHTSSLIDGVSIAINRNPTVSEGMTNSFAGTDPDENGVVTKPYSFKYADQVKIGSASGENSQVTTSRKVRQEVSITTTASKVLIEYDLSQYTTVTSVSGSNVKSTYTNDYEVCDYWNRSGNVSITLNLTASAVTTEGGTTDLSTYPGIYKAEVVVAIDGS